MKSNSYKDDLIMKIAKKLGIPTLESRNSDHLDFHEVSVWELKAALEEAYDSGVADGVNSVPEGMT